MTTSYGRLWLIAATAGMLSLLATGCGSGDAGAATLGGLPAAPPVAACTVPTATITHSGTSNGNAAQVVFLDPKTYPQAVCNDGSPAAYVLRPGVGAATKRWVLMLQGGFDCYDQNTCASRAAGSPTMVSSVGYKALSGASLRADGIESADPNVNPDFYDATQVLALYCSSDFWSGAKSGSGAFNPNAVSTWSFEGRAILSAVVMDLEKHQGLSHASELLLTGQSAGGVGVFATVNDVASLLPRSVRFVASSDAGFGSPAQDYSGDGSAAPYRATGIPAAQAELAEGVTLWGGHGDSACASAFGGSAQVNCYEGSMLVAPSGTVKLPMLVLEAQQDGVQLGAAGVPQAAINSGNFTAPESSYVQYFAQEMRLGLNGTNSEVSFFAPDALLHTQTDAAGLFNTAYAFSSGSVSPRQAVKTWYENPCAPQRNAAN
jgi:hypothetical protein